QHSKTKMAEIFLSGATLSALYYEHVNSPGDQEGFLIGKLSTTISDSISDSQINNLKEETVLNVFSHVPCPKPLSFYNAVGTIDAEKLQDLLQDKLQDIIGWYKFRRNSSSTLTTRERMLHANLISHAGPKLEKYFLFGLFSQFTTPNISTHTVEQVFMQYKRNVGFAPVAVNVMNLKDTAQGDYRLQSRLPVDPSSHLYRSMLQKADREHSNTQPHHLDGVSSILNINKHFSKGLERLSGEVCEEEKQLEQLSHQVEELRGRWREKQQQEAREAAAKLQLANKRKTPSPTRKNIPTPKTSPPVVVRKKTPPPVAPKSPRSPTLVTIHGDHMTQPAETSLHVLTQHISKEPLVPEKVTRIQQLKRSPKLRPRVPDHKVNTVSHHNETEAVNPLYELQRKSLDDLDKSSLQSHSDKSTSQSKSIPQSKSDSFSFIDDVIVKSKVAPEVAKKPTKSNSLPRQYSHEPSVRRPKHLQSSPVNSHQSEQMDQSEQSCQSEQSDETQSLTDCVSSQDCTPPRQTHPRKIDINNPMAGELESEESSSDVERQMDISSSPTF
ncbi:unnamed protein product, partial [Owenia fusiformis]